MALVDLRNMKLFAAVLAVAGFGFTFTGIVPVVANSSGDRPRTTIPAKCKKYKKNRKKLKRCIRRHAASLLQTEDIYAIGYWMAKRGEYEDAIRTLKRAEDAGDARVLTYIGFSTRKLGDVETAMDYYERAVALDPNYMSAREYMGEAFLQRGDLAGAMGQLDEIQSRCGAQCEEFNALSNAIKTFKARAI